MMEWSRQERIFDLYATTVPEHHRRKKKNKKPTAKKNKKVQHLHVQKQRTSEAQREKLDWPSCQAMELSCDKSTHVMSVKALVVQW